MPAASSHSFKAHDILFKIILNADVIVDKGSQCPEENFNEKEIDWLVW